MRKVRSNVLVVDADVAFACGASERPPAPQALRTLMAILNICHRVRVSDELNGEWRAHAARNRAFQRWRRHMLGRKKLIRAPVKGLALLVEQLVRIAENPGEQEQVRKDAHLVAAALEGAPVISLDDRMRRFLVRCLARMPHLERITWVNPLHSEEEVLAWLERGALPEAKHQLRMQSPP